MEGLPTPHNNLFQLAMSHLPNARSLIETNFSPEVLQEIDLDSLQIEPCDFVDTKLREKQSDLLLSARLREPQGSPIGKASSVYVYVLFEHKSEPDQLTVLQLLTYIVRFWEKCARDGDRLHPILPLVVYHGSSPWTVARQIEDLVACPAALADYQVRFRFPLLDLGRLPDEEIRGVPILQSVLQLLKYGRGPELPDRYADILRILASVLSEQNVRTWLEAFGVYVMGVNRFMSLEEMYRIVQSVFPTQIEPGSIADRLIKQGEEKGREEGREEGREQGVEKGLIIGKVQTLQELIGDQVSPIEKLLALNIQQLERTLLGLQERLRHRQ
jgi:predicted transposase/invertase (TIGR01784 family)